MSEQEGCPKCGGTMELGFLVDNKGGQQRQISRPLLWVESRQLRMQVEAQPGEGRLEVDTLRCVACGYLELYAGLGPE